MELLRIIRPLHPYTTPGEAAAKSSKDDVIAFMHLLFPLPKTKRDGSCGCVAVLLYVEHDFLRSNAHASARGVYDAVVCLVRHKPCNVFTPEVILFHDLG